MLIDAVEALQVARRQTLELTAFDEAELTRQHSPLMSPLVWDLAHIGQQEEYFLLTRVSWPVEEPECVYRPEIAALYDAFTHPRASRIRLPLLDSHASRQHLEQVRGRVLELLASDAPIAGDTGPHGGAFIAGMVAQHELQHIETMLATHQLRAGPPLLTGGQLPAGRPVTGGREDAVFVPGGPALIGVDAAEVPHSLDIERPQHSVQVAAFHLGRVPVTNAEWCEFIADGGYREARWWSSAGWAHREREGIQAPLFWASDGARGWVRQRFGLTEPVPAHEPVQHVNFFEAEAFARWAGGRLPTELEWEKAAAGTPEPRWGEANLGGRALRPAPVGAYPKGTSRYGAEQLLGDVWEWTSSPLSPWPGFEPMIYHNYSEPFFGPDYRVLRGGSWATDPYATRISFRNWDLPIRRQVFCGLRLAWDA